MVDGACHACRVGQQGQQGQQGFRPKHSSTVGAARPYGRKPQALGLRVDEVVVHIEALRPRHVCLARAHDLQRQLGRRERLLDVELDEVAQLPQRQHLEGLLHLGEGEGEG
jgi:hypothetical protein